MSCGADGLSGAVGQPAAIAKPTASAALASPTAAVGEVSEAVRQLAGGNKLEAPEAVGKLTGAAGGACALAQKLTAPVAKVSAAVPATAPWWSAAAELALAVGQANPAFRAAAIYMLMALLSHKVEQAPAAESVAAVRAGLGRPWLIPFAESLG